MSLLERAVGKLRDQAHSSLTQLPEKALAKGLITQEAHAELQLVLQNKDPWIESYSQMALFLFMLSVFGKGMDVVVLSLVALTDQDMLAGALYLSQFLVRAVGVGVIGRAAGVGILPYSVLAAAPVLGPIFTIPVHMALNSEFGGSQAFREILIAFWREGGRVSSKAADEALVWLEWFYSQQQAGVVQYKE